MPFSPVYRQRFYLLRFPVLVALGLAVLWAALFKFPRGDVLYGALIMATNSDHPGAPPPELRTQAENLKAIFGYNNLRLLGQRRIGSSTTAGGWLVPSRNVSLRINTKNPVPGGYLLNLALLQDNRVLVQADARLYRGQPLFIRGPFVGPGQIIILLIVL